MGVLWTRVLIHLTAYGLHCSWGTRVEIRLGSFPNPLISLSQCFLASLHRSTVIKEKEIEENEVFSLSFNHLLKRHGLLTIFRQHLLWSVVIKLIIN